MIFGTFSRTEQQQVDELNRIGHRENFISWDELQELREKTRPYVDRLASEITKNTGLKCDISEKSLDSAEEKVRRPETLRKYPWFAPNNLRDFLRFRTRVHRVADFEHVLKVMHALNARKEVSIVKFDVRRIVAPDVYGWRMISIDLRICRTGMIVEHYMTYDDLIAASD